MVGGLGVGIGWGVISRLIHFGEFSPLVVVRLANRVGGGRGGGLRSVYLVACGSACGPVCVVACGCLVSVFFVRKIFAKMC